MKAFVEATPISGPAFVKKTKSDSLANELEGTLHIPKRAKYPKSFANLKQAKVSAVSPDCEMVKNKVFGATTLFLYLNSLATSTLQGRPARPSNQYLATVPAW